jgi:hypothetical protein
VVLLTVIGGQQSVYCVTTVDRVAVDALAVDEPDLPWVFRELGCKPSSATAGGSMNYDQAGGH